MTTAHNNRREFLTLTTAAVGAFAAPSLALAGATTTTSTGDTRMATNRPSQLFKPEFRFGLGGVPLGNEFNKITDKDAAATLEAAWSAGVRYFDVAPWYGFGLAERRFGTFLHTKNRGDYILSSKVGKLLKASKTNRHADIFPLSGSPNDVVYDYTADGTRRSVEDSLQRFGVDSLDVVFVHDISPDFPYFPTSWEEQFAIAERGAFPELTRMRDEGLIKAWGIGVNRPEPILRAIQVADVDVCLCASQYSLIDHTNAVNQVFPAVREKNVSLVIGSALNAGFISGSARYNYGPDNYKIPAMHIEKRDQLRAVAARHGIDLRTAALQFSAAPDVAVALVVGASSDQQILEDYNSMQAKIPAEFWEELKSSGLIEQAATTPT
ncbi:L-fucose dehydrogenase [Hyphomicrobium nitrativorans NL23]|uniref:L-fucose dehydrogenase n=1 Tax=Hyphomicrobium nitrativorans NL23 TaxID=1029756 RepID=V5SBE7_9HYPH|nr:aldo/keto reductase [Hyphomicrobium nitrativorans]AHB47843.1 L-fucose dehydrogenase [Hyphomicrobium nitrativorans NL23]